MTTNEVLKKKETIFLPFKKREPRFELKIGKELKEFLEKRRGNEHSKEY